MIAHTYNNQYQVFVLPKHVPALPGSSYHSFCHSCVVCQFCDVTAACMLNEEVNLCREIPFSHYCTAEIENIYDFICESINGNHESFGLKVFGNFRYISYCIMFDPTFDQNKSANIKSRQISYLLKTCRPFYFILCTNKCFAQYRLW